MVETENQVLIKRGKKKPCFAKPREVKLVIEVRNQGGERHTFFFLMILLQQNNKRRESGEKCHARTMMHSKPINLST
jgi:hypothetical protein